MSWTSLAFGKHKGKTLPQVLFSDPDWFFWAKEKEVFKGNLAIEARELYNKARRIRIPRKREEDLVVEYGIHFPTGKFGVMELVPRERSPHLGSTPTFRSDYIDMMVPKLQANYDKLGYDLFLKNLKFILFGKKSYPMTRERCEEFFGNENNFDL